MTDNPETTTAPAVSPTSGRRRGRIWPGRFVWMLLALLTCVYIAVRLREWEDSAVGNIVSVIVLGLAGLTLLSWFSLFSDYRRNVRLALPVLIIGALAVLFSCFELRQTSGGLVPRFSWRWAPRIDERLGEVQIAAGAVDLATTTPFDYPQFLGPDRTAVVVHRSFSRDWSSNPPRLVWRHEIGAGWSSFAAVNGFAVTMQQRGPGEHVTCYEIATGKARWSHAVQTRHETVLGFVGPRATPTIHNGRVFALGATGILRCLNGVDGLDVWRRDLFAEHDITQEEGESGVWWGRSGSPLVVDDKVIVGIGGSLRGPKHGLGAYHVDTGEPIWETGGYQVSYASPSEMTIAGRRQIVCVMQDFVVGFGIDNGEVLWEHPWPGSSTAKPNVSQAKLVGDNRLFLSKGYFHGAELIELQRPGEDWEIKSLWRNAKLMKTKFSNTAIKDGFVYGLDDIALSCVELETGKRKWKKGRYRYGQVLLAEDVVLVATEDGRLVMVDANPEKFDELGSVHMIEGQTWNNACLYGRYVLLRNSIEAACVELPAR